jgi:hypothetical protein
MSRLHEETYGGAKGWQWDDGPVFLGHDGRRWAIEYGKAIRRMEELTSLAELHHKRILGEERLKTLEQQQDIIEKVKTFRFHWKDGLYETGLGKTVPEAFKSLGYESGAMAALDHYEEIE